MPLLRKGLVLAGITAILVLAVWNLRHRWVETLRQDWLDRLAVAAPAEATELLTRAARAGAPSLELAVDALNAAQPRTAEAAYEVLHGELDIVLTRADGGAALWQEHLAAALAVRSETFRPEAKRRAAELALRMLTSLERRPNINRARLVADCERVIALSGERPTGSTAWRLPRAEPPAVAPAAAVATNASPREDFGPNLLNVLPGGGANDPLVPCPLPEAAPKETEPGDAPPGTTASGPGKPGPARTPSANPRKPNADDAGALRPMSLSVPDEQPLPAGASLPVNRSDRSEQELMRQLRGPTAAADAEAELTRRGFGPVELSLARRLVDPDANVRRELARMLPQMGSIQPTPWLLWLCADEDAEVRLAAASLLATSNDRETLSEVQKLLRDDPDARVRRCVEVIGERQKPQPPPKSKRPRQ